jgi:RNA polymerase sigma factor (sigma-70 family)
MPPPPAEPFASRIFLGPALRAQPDRRLVKLVREGYETAFEEIVRRYRKPLDRFAAAFVGARSEDVTQDAFSKALLALRGSENEIELRPWLYRIVRNTALNELRDRPPSAEELNEVALAGGLSAAGEAERREEMAELMERLRALPEPQRAAIVMRELEGLSHEEIAAALGVSGGAARQAIYRARATLRDGFGLLVPLPLLRFLFDHGSEAVGAGGAAAAAGAGAATGGGAILGGFGAAGAIKVGLATAVLAGSVGAGVAMQQQDKGGRADRPSAAAASVLANRDSSSSSSGSGGGSSSSGPGPGLAGSDDRGRGSDGGDDRQRGRGRGGDDRGENEGLDDSSHGGPGPSGGSGSSGSGHGGRGLSGGSDDRSGHSGGGTSGDRHSIGSGSSGGGSSGSGHGGSDGGGSRDGSGDSSGSGSGGSGSSHGSDSGSGGGSDDHGDEPVLASPPPPPPPEAADDGGGSGDSGSGSGSGSSGGSGEDSPEDDS